MATTDARAGFRLPWTSDRPSTDQADGDQAVELDFAAATGWPGEDVASTAKGPEAAGEPAPKAPTPALQSTPEPPPPAPSGRKPSRFLADMTKAMQAAAEDARARSLAQLQSDAKSQVEVIHGRSSTDAADLRKAADDDVAAVREWSKAEIAQIREETDARIADRKGRLEREIEEHASVIEREIEAVQATVASFEADMAAFFERLLAEEDPTHFATMFQNLPEPPSLEDLVVAPAAVAVAEPEALTAKVEAVAETKVEPEAAVDATVEADPSTDADDPRFAALGLSPDFGAAEAEAFADAGPSGADEEIEIPVIGDEALAARLAGLVLDPDATATATTQVVVVGLVSVASIASFKRHLGRLPGVSSVGVSSGPEGEFVFTVGHSADVVLRDVIPGLPTFQARVTGSTDGTVHVTAHDPESDA